MKSHAVPVSSTLGGPRLPGEQLRTSSPMAGAKEASEKFPQSSLISENCHLKNSHKVQHLTTCHTEASQVRPQTQQQPRVDKKSQMNETCHPCHPRRRKQSPKTERGQSSMPLAGDGKGTGGETGMDWTKRKGVQQSYNLTRKASYRIAEISV